MSRTRSVVSIACAGTKAKLRDSEHVQKLMALLEEKGIACNIVDTMSGWGNLNQDWLEFTSFVETSWCWCWPCCIDEGEWLSTWLPLFEQGILLMQVHYRVGDRLVAHH